MSRTVKKPEIRRQELIDIALRQFISLGYEKASIRSIVKEANGEIGMFYHHFASKEEMFETALKRFNSNYIIAMENIIDKNLEMGFIELLGKIMLETDEAIEKYRDIQPQKVNWQMLSIFHQSTLSALHPVICETISRYIERGKISPPDVELGLLANFVLSGASAVIHDKNISDMNMKNENLKKMLTHLFNIPNLEMSAE